MTPNSEDSNALVEKKERISAKFAEQRASVSKEIYENIQFLTSLKTLKDAQVNMLSLRQRLLEDNHTLLEHVTVLRRRLRGERSGEMESISRNMQIRYQATEKTVVIDGRTATTKEYLEIFENQINFSSESIKTIDSVLYGIKTRLDIEKTIGM